ncbi:UDP-N-acetyl-D-glucosamine 2-epimerase, UDP-hydrolysing [Gammaproteobacteria bacterium 45_16_T64]|nr:UDP-N-acetyl-D-glucosamine 2-epimerase, UDP-hydrolysing [Gammaproteobacteria bacterium 45_16_T64]
MRKIAVFTGTRAEYGLLYWIIRRLHESNDVELCLMVGGAHLSPEFGYTVEQIDRDGFEITERLEFLMSSDSAVGVSKSMGLALISASESFERCKPDLLVVLGDRFEAMAIVQAAMIACVPVAHIHGGEITEGLIDEAVRHSITKMSHLHFASTETYRKRIMQLGEEPSNVFNSGAPGIDSIFSLELLERSEVSDAVGFSLETPYFVVTYHPVTLELDGAVFALENLLQVLSGYPNHKLIITYPNADTHGRRLIKVLEAYQSQNANRVLLVQSLGQLRYLSLLKYCDLVIGNSSSGLIEAPTFGVPTINIGSRQKGRVAGETVLHCGESVESIREAMKTSLTKEFRENCKSAENPYGDGGASQFIVEELIGHPLDNILSKRFCDMEPIE